MYWTSYQASDDVVGYLRVDVSDSGAGIAKEDQCKVFGQFAQFNKSELQGGGKYISVMNFRYV